jgi:hypothetical protein
MQTRDNSWLEERLAQIWYRYFADIEQPNEVSIHFGRRSSTRLGSIIREPGPNKPSIITITGYFKDEKVPPYVVDSTIAHELVHYAHGFHSPHPQLYRYPHQGGIVDKELQKRGLGSILRSQKAWLKQEWLGIVGTKKGRVVRFKLWSAR